MPTIKYLLESLQSDTHLTLDPTAAESHRRLSKEVMLPLPLKN